MDMEEELNDDWIKDFECIDNKYKDLYNSDVFFIHLHFVYINKEIDIFGNRLNTTATFLGLTVLSTCLFCSIHVY